MDIEKLKDAIANNYFFEMFVEDLPMWGYIGDIEDEDMIVGEMMGASKTYLFTHLNFIIGHNNKQIVSAKVTTDVSSPGFDSRHKINVVVDWLGIAIVIVGSNCTDLNHFRFFYFV